jgi:hypothetical protein
MGEVQEVMSTIYIYSLYSRLYAARYRVRIFNLLSLKNAFRDGRQYIHV